MSKASRRPKTFIFLGVSGSGKDTMAKRVQEILPRAQMLSTGDGLRAVMRRKNRTGQFVRSVLERGDLLPYWAAAYVWLRKFFEELQGDEHIIFTGAPRRIEEARLMDDFMPAIDRALPIAIYLNVSEQNARERLLARGRYDDNEAAIRARFRYFKRYVHPVIRYYRRRSRLIEVNGDPTPDAVWRDLRRQLKL